jgi:carbon storage regulator CsrA
MTAGGSGVRGGARQGKAMLILSRKLDEQIVIAGNIFIKVIELNGRTVKLGIEAPRDIEVMRAELLENDAAASPPISAAL